MDVKVGSLIRIYDSCIQKDVIEPVVRIIEDSSYGKLIYSARENWLGYDERLSQIENIKEVMKNKL